MDKAKKQELLNELKQLQKLRSEVEAMPDDEPEVINSPERSFETSTSESLFPRVAEAKEKGKGLLGQVGAGILDVGSNLLSVPVAAITSGKQPSQIPSTSGKMIDVGEIPKEESFKERLNTIKNSDDIVDEVISDPANILTPLTLGGGALATKIPIYAKWMGKLNLTGKGAKAVSRAKNVAEAGTSATIHQTDKSLQGKETSAGEFALETATGGLGFAYDALKAGKNFSQQLAANFANVDLDLIKRYGIGFGKNAKQLVDATKMENVDKVVSTVFEYAKDATEMAKPLRQELNRILLESPDVDFKNFNETFDEMYQKLKLAPEINKGKLQLLDNIQKDVKNIKVQPSTVFEGKKTVSEKVIDEDLVEVTDPLTGQKKTVSSQQTKPTIVNSDKGSVKVGGNANELAGASPIYKTVTKEVPTTKMLLGNEIAQETRGAFLVDQIRQQLDQYAGYTGIDTKASNDIAQALAGALAEDVKEAGGDVARDLFQKSHNLLTSSGRVKKSFGLSEDLPINSTTKKDPGHRDKVFNFIRTFYGPDSYHKVQFLEDLDKIFDGELGKSLVENNNNAYKGQLGKKVKEAYEAFQLSPLEKIPSKEGPNFNRLKMWQPANPQALAWSMMGSGGVAAAGKPGLALIPGIITAAMAARSRGAAGAFAGSTDFAQKSLTKTKNFAPKKLRDVTKQATRSVLFNDKNETTPEPFVNQ